MKQKRCGDGSAGSWTCGKFKKKDEFYKYKSGRLHSECIECSKKRERDNYYSSTKHAAAGGMSGQEIDDYLKAHPIDRASIRARYRAR